MIEQASDAMPTVGQWCTVRVWGKERLAHVEFTTDGIRQAYMVTVYKGDAHGLLSAEYWRGISDASVARAFAVVSELIAAEGPPPPPAALPVPL